MAKKASKTSAKKKPAAKKKTETAKKPASKKTAAKKAPAKKSGPASKAKKVAAPAKTKKSAASDDGRILFRQFETVTPETLYKPEPDAAYESGFSAPPFFSRKPRNYKKIMARRFDFDLAEAAAAGPAKPKKTKKAAAKSTSAKTAAKKTAAIKKDAVEETAEKTAGKKAPAKKSGLHPVPKPGTKSAAKSEAKPVKEADATDKKAKKAEPKKTAAKSAPKKAAVKKADGKSAPKKAPSIPELLKRSYPSWTPAHIVTSAPAEGTYSAPPLYDAEPEGLREIMGRSFDLDFAALAREAVEKAAAEEAARTEAQKEAEKEAEKARRTAWEAERRKLSRADLLRLSFDAWQPETLYTAPGAGGKYTAPPLFDSPPDGLNEMLKRSFDFDFAALAEQSQKDAKAAAAAEKTRIMEEDAEAARRLARQKAAEADVKAARLEKEIADREAEVDQMKADRRRRFRPLAYSAAGIGLIFSLVTAQSYRNQGHFYLADAEDRVEVRQGAFSPMGDRLLVTLPADAVSAERKSVYDKAEAYEMLYEYYLGVADASLASSDTPTLENVKMTLEKAAGFALTKEDKEVVRLRLVRVELMLALAEADMAATRNNLQRALSILKSAQNLDLNDRQASIVSGKIALVEKLMGGGVTAPKPAIPEANGVSH